MHYFCIELGSFSDLRGTELAVRFMRASRIASVLNLAYSLVVVRRVLATHAVEFILGSS